MKSKKTPVNSKRKKTKKKPPMWRASVFSYLPEDLKVLTFADEAAMSAAFDLLWDRKLDRIPFEFSNESDSIVIPAEGVHFFTEAGLQFTIHNVLDPQNLTAEEWAELRK